MSLKEKINKSLSKITNKNLDGQEGDNKKTRKIQIYVGVAVVCVIVAVGCLVIYNNTRKPDVPQVQTYMVPENEKIFINGLIIPSKSKEIAGPANGSTPDIRVSNGQTVKTGDVLYIVKDEAAIAEIASIKTQISNLIKEKRSMNSDDPNLFSINSQISTLNSNLSLANAKAYTKVKSPIDGKVYLNNNSNSSSNSSSSIMTIQTTEYVMSGQISEQDLSKVKADMTSDVTILSTGETVKARVSSISDRPISSGPPRAAAPGESSGGSDISFYAVTLTFDTQEGIIDGYHAQAAIEVNTDRHKIPSKAIINNGDEVYVLLNVDGILTKVNVEIISEGDEYVTVSGNLNENDIVIKNPTKTMKDGDPVPGTGEKSNASASKK